MCIIFIFIRIEKKTASTFSQSQTILNFGLPFLIVYFAKFKIQLGLGFRVFGSVSVLTIRLSDILVSEFTIHMVTEHGFGHNHSVIRYFGY